MQTEWAICGYLGINVSSNYLRDASVEWDFYAGYLKPSINSQLECLFFIIITQVQKYG